MKFSETEEYRRQKSLNRIPIRTFVIVEKSSQN